MVEITKNTSPKRFGRVTCEDCGAKGLAIGKYIIIYGSHRHDDEKPVRKAKA